MKNRRAARLPHGAIRRGCADYAGFTVFFAFFAARLRLNRSRAERFAAARLETVAATWHGKCFVGRCIHPRDMVSQDWDRAFGAPKTVGRYSGQRSGE